MAKITINETAETEVEVTADYCFGKAAAALAGLGRPMHQDPTVAAREWRELGEALARHSG